MKISYDGIKILKTKLAVKQKFLHFSAKVDFFHISEGNLGFVQSYFIYKNSTGFSEIGRLHRSPIKLNLCSNLNSFPIPWFFTYYSLTKVATIIASFTFFDHHIFPRLVPCGLMYMGICLKLLLQTFERKFKL